MAYPSFPLDDLDIDEFDWEAAVRDIDSACQGAAASTSGQPLLAPPASVEPAAAAGTRPDQGKAAGKARQSTLDRFVDSFAKHKKRDKGCSEFSVPEKNVQLDSPSHGELQGRDEPAGVEIDLEAAKTWIYPVNVPLRDYQFSITKTALFSNTLVALPTGLGKTLIAAVVMYNYFRWFPEGKIAFAAPSRPLVLQQIEACHKIVGISQEWTIDMTGQMSPQKRSHFWKSKRVFFVTPQVLEKDIQSGICLVKQLVCLVIDEAHRALGNYSYCVAVRELMSVPVQLRILALTATPGSKQQAIQKVIDNLCISTLEYRNESDQDVSRYVHNRKLELIQVAMGEDAVGISNLLLDVIRPYVSRLCGFGVLPARDYATLSPCELLNSRDKFRQAPPSSLPQAKFGEIEGCFGVLITLYHIRKLLSSHGIRPAYEMLEEKLRQGSFARLMSKNETIWKAKLLMQQSLSLGAPNPKVVKMIGVLLDHFKTKDPKDSRVIIFSNFRGSVKDIMDSLSNIGDMVKATEFIGQSSGKTLKGQSQKTQQAVLQKFRTGGYNVIVATSIGEEGLDIMEVDLVICFDANVSPLRMIQRMGRTGRNHDGRVVILACEGSELKGYLRKQASSKAVRKHMHNGGSKSFDFHASPRMVPHICKPEVQFIELSIEQFIPRGKKKKDDVMHGSPVLERLSDGERDLIVRYFHLRKENIWKPSLIAFPSFQAFPSRVHTVKHSLRTTAMLIEAMQHLQGLSFAKVKSSCSIKVETSSPPSFADVNTARNNTEKVPVMLLRSSCALSRFKNYHFPCCDGAESTKEEDQRTWLETLEHDMLFRDLREDIALDSTDVHHVIRNASQVLFQAKGSDASTPFRGISESKYVHYVPDSTTQKPPVHCFLFEGDFVTVSALGSVCLRCVPSLPYKRSVVSELIMKENNDDIHNTRDESTNSKASAVDHGMLLMQWKDAAEVAGCTQMKSTGDEGIVAPHSPINGVQKEQESDNSLLQTPVAEGKLAHSGEVAAETPGDTEKTTPTSLAVKRGTFKETDLSPRLTHFIEEGIVPESPIHCSSAVENNACASFKPECLSNVHGRKVQIDATSNSAMLFSTSKKNGSPVPSHVSPNIHKFSSLSSVEILTLDKGEQGNMHDTVGVTGKKGNVSGSPSNKALNTPLVNQMSKRSSDNWQLTPREASESILQAPKYKRLRKYGDKIKKMPCKTFKGKFSCIAEEQCEPTTTKQMNGKTKKAKKYFNSFIDEEAEVSDDAEISEDEEENENPDEFDDSFIDDRVNPTEASTQAASKGGDMMAFYRRSLLTQSPMEILPGHLADSYDSASLRTTESGSCSSEKAYSCLQTPRDGPQSVNHPSANYSVTCRLYSERASFIRIPGEASCSGMECPSKLESRKRKLSFQTACSSPVIEFQPEDTVQLENSGKASLQCQPGIMGSDNNVFDDDDFYQGLDLDAVEAQATEILRCKSCLSIDKKQPSVHNHTVQIKRDPVVNIVSSPTFDLGSSLHPKPGL